MQRGDNMQRVANKSKSILIATIILLTVAVLGISMAFSNNAVAFADEGSSNDSFKLVVSNNFYECTSSCSYLNGNQWLSAYDGTYDSFDYLLSFGTESDYGTLLLNTYQDSYLETSDYEDSYSLGFYDSNSVRFIAAEHSAKQSYSYYSEERFFAGIVALHLTEKSYSILFYSLGEYYNNFQFLTNEEKQKYILDNASSHIVYSWNAEDEFYPVIRKHFLEVNGLVIELPWDIDLDVSKADLFNGCFESLTLYKNMKAPVKEGYKFVGWYYDEAFTRLYDGEEIGEDVNLYAKFEKIKVTVTFDGSQLDDPSDPNNVGLYSSVSEIDYGSFITYVPISPDHMVFDGWYFEDGTKYEGTAVTENITLVGKWVPSECTIYFNSGDKDVTFEPILADYGSIVLMKNFPTYNKERYRIGIGSWSLSTVEEAAVEFVTEDSFRITKDMHFDAEWEKYIFTVTFYVDNEVFKSVDVEKGKTLGSVALDENVESNTVVGYENLNAVTAVSSFEEFKVEDDVAVYCSSAPIDENLDSGDVDVEQDNSVKSAFDNFFAKIKAFFEKIGVWFKNLFSKFKR